MLKFHNRTDAFDKMFNEFFTTRNSKSCAPQTERTITPAADILETDENFVLNIVIPGFSKEEIKIDLNEDRLEVSAERTFEKEEGTKYHKLQTRYGKFSRTFIVPNSVDAEHIKAAYEAGILTLTLPKRPEEPGKTIEVK